ncbi:MAG: class I SAM-dependent methyltransferase [bacterium]|nr:class I SAM-dependent methyltransferase [bacterium]
MMPEDYFGEGIAERYDAGAADLSTPEVVGPVVDFLANLAGEGRALEFGIGTGRIGLPLHERGIPVDGIDLSAAMLRQLEGKPGADSINAIEGNFASMSMEGTYTLVYLVFNTINNLTTQDEQVACFRNAANHLEPGGYFVIEVNLPKLRMLPPGQNLHTFHLSENRWGIDEYHFATQDFTSHHFAVRDGELKRMSVPFRYVFPEELDLMAKIAGMSRFGRWAGWEDEPFTDDSTKHVSVWQKHAE